MFLPLPNLLQIGGRQIDAFPNDPWQLLWMLNWNRRTKKKDANCRPNAEPR
jgi:hypothetical protein